MAHPKARTPFTVVLEEVVTDAVGTSRTVAQRTEALRTDGSTVTVFGHAGRGRRINLISGVVITVNDSKRRKSTVAKSVGLWAGDPEQRCVKSVTGQLLSSGASVIGTDRVNGYVAAKIQFAKHVTQWRALDHGCALLRQTMDFGSQGSSDTRLVALIPGEPRPEMFTVPNDYEELPPSKFAEFSPGPACDARCQELWWTPFFGQKKTPSLDRAAALKMKESQCQKFARVTHRA